MVGGLIEEKEVGILKEQAGQIDAHAPAAAEFAHRALVIIFLESQSRQDRLGLVFDGVAAESIIARFQGAEAFEQLFIILGMGIENGMQSGDLFFEKEDLPLSFEYGGEDGTTARGDLLLGQIADGVLSGLDHHAIVRRQLALDDAQQGGLARAIGTDEGDPFAGIDDPVDILEQEAIADMIGEISDLKHGLQYWSV